MGSTPKRMVALVGTLFLLLGVAGEAFGFHPCPYHQGGDHHADPAAETGSHAEHGAPADHQAHHHPGDHEGHPAPEPTDQSGHGGELCPHIGLCHVPAATPAQEELATTTVWFADVVRLSVVAPDTQAAPAFHPPFFLPYSLAPPLAG